MLGVHAAIGTPSSWTRVPQLKVGLDTECGL
jgi:hypothetical protein